MGLCCVWTYPKKTAKIFVTLFVKARNHGNLGWDSRSDQSLIASRWWLIAEHPGVLRSSSFAVCLSSVYSHWPYNLCQGKNSEELWLWYWRAAHSGKYCTFGCILICTTDALVFTKGNFPEALCSVCTWYFQ